MKSLPAAGTCGYRLGILVDYARALLKGAWINKTCAGCVFAASSPVVVAVPL